MSLITTDELQEYIRKVNNGEMKIATGAMIVSYDFSKRVNDKGKEVDNDILLVGVKSKGMTADIINAFTGDEAREIFKKLTTRPRPAGDPHVD